MTETSSFDGDITGAFKKGWDVDYGQFPAFIQQ